MFIGEDEVSAALQQSTDANGELLYVNKYGDLKPFSEVEDSLVNRKTLKFSLDDLTDKRTSAPATVTGGKNALSADLSADQGYNFGAANTNGTTDLSAASRSALNAFMTVDVDNSGSPVTVDLSALNTATYGAVTGTELADFIQDLSLIHI